MKKGRNCPSGGEREKGGFAANETRTTKKAGCPKNPTQKFYAPKMGNQAITGGGKKVSGCSTTHPSSAGGEEEGSHRGGVKSDKGLNWQKQHKQLREKIGEASSSQRENLQDRQATSGNLLSGNEKGSKVE